jgi:hypothetical protein
MAIIYVPRFGGTLILQITPPVPPALNAQMSARKGTAMMHARKGSAVMHARKGTITLYGRKP